MKNTNKKRKSKKRTIFCLLLKTIKRTFWYVEELNEAEEAYYAKQKAKRRQGCSKRKQMLKK